MIRPFAHVALLSFLAVGVLGCASDVPLDCPEGTSYRKGKIGGRASSICINVEQKLHGPTVSWHRSGKKETEGHYREGMPHGTFSQWSKEGTLLGTYEMSDGTGTVIRWHEDGKKSEESSYRENKKDGHSTTWHPNGQKAEGGAYEAGAKHGAWSSWDEDGEVTKTEEYDEGKLVDEGKPENEKPE